MIGARSLKREFDVVNHRVYDSFGNLISQANAQASIDFGFTGKYRDPETGLSYHWNRWFDPALGKWLTADPIGFAAGDPNLYRYVGNASPLATDPTGWVEETGGGPETRSSADFEKEFSDIIFQAQPQNITDANTLFQSYLDTPIESEPSLPSGRLRTKGDVWAEAIWREELVREQRRFANQNVPRLESRPYTYRDRAIDLMSSEQRDRYFDLIEYEARRRLDERQGVYWYGSQAMALQRMEEQIALNERGLRYFDMTLAERLFHPDSIFNMNDAIMLIGIPAGPPPIAGVNGRPSARARTFGDLMNAAEARRYERYWGQGHVDGPHNTRQREYTTPGIRSIRDQKISSKTGELYTRETIYDDFGRRIGNNDFTDHGRPDVHPSPHHHPNTPFDTKEHGPVTPGVHPLTPRR